MSFNAVNNIPMSLPQSDIERLKAQKPADLDAEKARLVKATKEFESFFMYQLMKTMRKTVPKSSFGDGGALSSGMGKDIFTDMFDMQLSRKMTNGGPGSISSMLYRSMEKIIEASYIDNEKQIELKSLPSNRPESIELKTKENIEIKLRGEGIKLEKISDEFMPVTSPVKRISNDDILSRYGNYIDAAARDTSLAPAIIISVIKAESNGNPNAVSSAGAKGLMQLIDSTASDYGVEEVFNPRENILAGSRYLKDLIDRFGSVKLGLAAYNAGPGNVMRYNGIPPFKETENYVSKVIDSLKVITGINNINVTKVVD